MPARVQRNSNANKMLTRNKSLASNTVRCLMEVTAMVLGKLRAVKGYRFQILRAVSQVPFEPSNGKSLRVYRIGISIRIGYRTGFTIRISYRPPCSVG